MASQQEISSTEKLLDFIRKSGDGKNTDSENSIASSHSGRGRPSRFLFNFTARKNTLSAGLDFGKESLRCLTLSKFSDRQWQIRDFRKIPLPADLQVKTPQFTAFLKRALNGFQDSCRKLALWTTLSSDLAEARSIRIPKVGKKQIENAVLWTAKKEINFDDKKVVFDYSLQGEVIDNGVTKLSAVVALAPRDEVKSFRDLFQVVDFPLDGLTLTPFIYQNIFQSGWLSCHERTAVLDIGREGSRIDIFFAGTLVLSRRVRTGISSMIESLMDEYNEFRFHPSLREEEGIDFDAAEKAFFQVFPDVNVSFQEEVPKVLEEVTVHRMTAPALERLLRQIERTFDYYTVTLGNEGIGLLYVTSTSMIAQFVADFLGEQLKIETALFDPLGSGHQFAGDSMAEHSFPERSTYIPALGLALSDSRRTPNLLLTYKEKAKLATIRFLNRIIFTGFSAGLAILTAVFLWLDHDADQKRIVLSNLEKQFIGLRIDEDSASRMISEVKREQGYLRKYTERYIGVAAIGELTALTPRNIRFIDIKAELAGENNEKKDNPGTGNLVVNGLVQGESPAFDSILGGYIVRLQQSPVFGNVSILNRKIENLQGDDVLRFTLSIEIA